MQLSLHGDAVHLHGRGWRVLARRHLRDGDHRVEGRLVDGLAEDGVLGLARREPVEEGVVDDVHEELRAAGVGRAGIGHGERAGLVGDARRVLVLDVAAVAARLGGARDDVLEGAVRWPASASIAVAPNATPMMPANL